MPAWGKVGERYSPVALKVFALANSHIPAQNCARPPMKSTIPTIVSVSWMFQTEALNRDSIKVVDAKANRPPVTPSGRLIK